MRILIAILFACTLASADTIVLKDGSKIEGKVVGTANGKTGVKTDAGKMVWIDEATIDHIEKAAPPAVDPPKDPPKEGDPAAQNPPPKTPPKAAAKGPKCPNCKGRRVVKCTSCDNGIADILCPECAGSGFLPCPTCKGAAGVPCPTCGGKNPKCPVCSGTFGLVDCPNCRHGAVDCPRCKGTRMIQGPCPLCKRKKVVPCPVCQGTGVDPTALPPPDPGGAPPPGQGTPPAGQGTPTTGGTAEPPPAEEPPPDEVPPDEQPPKEAPKEKSPPIVLASGGLEALSGVIDGIHRTDGKKLWRITVKITNGEDLGSLVIRAADFTLRIERDEEMKPLAPDAGTTDAPPLMLGKGKPGAIRLYFETAYEATPRKILFSPPKWKGDPFTVELPKPGK